MMKAEDGDMVSVSYTGTFPDGKVFDSSDKHKKPLEFTIGQKMVIRGFEENIRGMEKGQEKKIELEPAQAYGEHNGQLVQKIPKKSITAEGGEVKEGMQLMVGLKNGQQIPARIVGVEPENVTIDLNHPLAGKKLVFNIKVEDIKKRSENTTATPV